MAENDGHDRDVHVVDKTGSYELANGCRPSANSDVQATRRLACRIEGLSRFGVDEIDVVPPSISIVGLGW